MTPRSRLRAALVWAFLCAAILIEAGILRQGETKALDGRWPYVAGLCWRSGASPYDPDVFYERWRQTFEMEPIGSLAYPPTIGVVAIPLSLLPWSAARVVYPLVSLLAFAATLAMVARMTCGGGWWRQAAPWFWMGTSCLVGAVAGSLYLAQATLITLAGAVGALYLGGIGVPLAAAAPFVLATIKPQLTFVLLAYGLGVRGVATVVSGVVATLAVCLAVLATASMGDLPRQIAATLDSHVHHPFNRADQYVGLMSLLGEGAAAKLVLGVALLAVPLALVFVGRRARRAAGSEHAEPLFTAGLQLALAAGAIVAPLHEYDLVLYVPLIVTLAATPRRWLLALLAPLVVLMRPRALEKLAALAGVTLDPALLIRLAGLVLLALCAARWFDAARAAPARPDRTGSRTSP